MKKIFALLIAALSVAFVACGDEKTDNGNDWFLTPEYSVDGTTVELLMPILAYKEELDLCDEIGVDAVIDEILESNRGSFALDVRRANVAAGGTYE